jgi:hypothetical protein
MLNADNPTLWLNLASRQRRTNPKSLDPSYFSLLTSLPISSAICRVMLNLDAHFLSLHYAAECPVSHALFDYFGDLELCQS